MEFEDVVSVHATVELGVYRVMIRVSENGTQSEISFGLRPEDHSPTAEAIRTWMTENTFSVQP